MVKLNKEIVCKDGFVMSVQANEGAYCHPRVDNAPSYRSVEVGFPSHFESLLLNWADNPERPTNTVYGYVPVATIILVCAKHGGVISGELPPGIPALKAVTQ